MKPFSLLRFGADRRGAVHIEMALALPVMITLLVAAVETVNYVLVHQKLERTSATLSDLVSQSPRMTEGLMTSLFAAVEPVMQPYELIAGGNVVVSSISANGAAAPRINWQRSIGNGPNNSEFGAQGAAATLPAGFIVRDGDNVIACEAWFPYQPLLLPSLIPAGTLYRSSLFRPRFGKLDTIAP
ncbi:MAG TPA: TadE/TadG family type IV pilus assembly protein [Rhodospirillales bacterium]|nr:TadE/TadG family type IV pilus assembly protein [Rhodospirillales bacterium]